MQKGEKMSEEQKNKLRGRKFSLEHRMKLSVARKKVVGWHHSDETKRKIRESNTGKNQGKVPTLETRQKISKANKGHIGWNKGKKAPWCTGEKNSMWKGGISTENNRVRQSLEYRLWRTAIFERDGYACIWCGAKNEKGLGKTVVLNADHIKPFYLFPELRFALDNGRTLCNSCHKTTDTFGYKLSNKTRLRK